VEGGEKQLESPLWKQISVGIVSGLIVFGVVSVGGALISLLKDASFGDWIVYALLPASVLGLVVSLGAYLYLAGQADTMLWERIASMHLQLTITQRLLIREQMRDVIAAAEERGWTVEDDIAEVPSLPFASSAALQFKAPDGATVKVAPLQEMAPAPAKVAAELANASPNHFPANWRPRG
jgi:hypothetical protein